MSLEEAREHLDLASKQWERATSNAWEPSDAASCVTNVFCAYENLIVSVAEAKGIARMASRRLRIKTPTFISITPGVHELLEGAVSLGP